jgi:hypothetical protein
VDPCHYGKGIIICNIYGDVRNSGCACLSCIHDIRLLCQSCI